MPRVTATEVKAIFDTSLSDETVEVHIEIANGIVSTELASSGHSASRLKDIERYLSAHLLSLRDPVTGMVRTEWVASEAKIDFSSDFGQMLRSTHFGQTAIMLDTTGRLENLGRRRAVFRAI